MVDLQILSPSYNLVKQTCTFKQKLPNTTLSQFCPIQLAWSTATVHAYPDTICIQDPPFMQGLLHASFVVVDRT